jgi:hypothetical protein
MNKKVWVVDICEGKYSDMYIEKTVVFEDEQEANNFAQEWDDKADKFHEALVRFKESADFKKRENEYYTIRSSEFYDWKAQEVKKIADQCGVLEVASSDWDVISTDLREAELVMAGTEK